MKATRFLVSGRVQGVFFRAATHERALTLGITGYAKNLPDGRVEVLAHGSAEAVGALEAWLHQGPPAARVERVEREEIASEDCAGFTTH
ncbi:MAG: acylphosphatase [Xanthomonadales bacterium]|nr:acylphosphatase [Xanthomonadales bacterium]